MKICLISFFIVYFSTENSIEKYIFRSGTVEYKLTDSYGTNRGFIEYQFQDYGLKDSFLVKASDLVYLENYLDLSMHHMYLKSEGTYGCKPTNRKKMGSVVNCIRFEQKKWGIETHLYEGIPIHLQLNLEDSTYFIDMCSMTLCGQSVFPKGFSSMKKKLEPCKSRARSYRLKEIYSWFK